MKTNPLTPQEMEKSLGDTAKKGTVVTPQEMEKSLGDTAKKGTIVTPQEMEKSLRDAAKKGSVDDLYLLIRRDVDILDKIDKKSFVETPLHVAAVEGQTKFAMEVLRLKRSFSKKLNEDGHTPMHLALQANQNKMVRCLLDFDEELVRVHGRDGLTPLHYGAKIANLDLLAEFLKACPRSVEDVTNGRETVLHVALNYGTPQAFQFLLGWLRRTWFKHSYSLEKKLLNAKDEEGNTVLHISIAKNLPEIVKSLLKFNSPFRRVIDINIKNSGGFTAFDMLQVLPDRDMEEIKQMLNRAKRLCPLQAPDLQPTDYFNTPVKWEEKIYISFLRQSANISDSTRNALLVVAVLLVTITFQATITPPGGVWSDNYPSATQNMQHRIRANFNSGFNGTTPHAVGTVTMEANIFILLSVLNCVSFFVSIFLLLILLPDDLRSGMFALPLYALSLCFLAALFITTPINVFGFHMPPNHYILFCVLSPLLFLALEGLVLFRRKKLVKAFVPQMKELDPNLHLFTTLF